MLKQEDELNQLKILFYESRMFRNYTIIENQVDRNLKESIKVIKRFVVKIKTYIRISPVCVPIAIKFN
jgi:hypothetical protein